MTDHVRRVRPPLDRDLLADPAALPAGWRVDIEEATPSTNAVAAERARGGAAEGYVVTTEHQTAGRGRLDRLWETPARSALALSVVLRPTAGPERWPWLPLAAGVAVTRTVRSLGIDAGVKWPNDVLVGAAERRDLKVCGILVERVETPTGPTAIVGIGLNTSQTREELPIPTATSLALEAGGVDRTRVLLTLLGELAEAYAAWRDRPEELAADYRALSATLGREVRAEMPGGEVVIGTAVRLDPDGRLVIAGERGEQVVGAGDVVHARLQ